MSTNNTQQAARFTRENVILMNVRHERVYSGETDELIRRERCDAANFAMREVVAFVGVEPDWCLDRWLADEKQMVAAVVCEDVKVAEAMRKGLAEYARQMAEAKKDNDIPIRDDGVLADEIAAHVDAEWRRVHAAEMSRLTATLSKAKVTPYGHRVLLGRWTPGADDVDGSKLNAIVSAAVNAAVPDGTKLEYSMRLDGETKDLIAAFGLQTPFAATALADKLADASCHVTRLVEADMDSLCDCSVVTAAYVVGRLMGREKAGK